LTQLRPFALLAVCLALTTCSPPRSDARPPKASPAESPTEWTYRIEAVRGGGELDVHAVFPPGASPELGVDEGCEPFVRDVAVARGEVWQPVPSRDGGTWSVPSCASAGCTIRYHFALAQAATALADMDTAISAGDAYLAPPSTWLLRPTLAPSIGRFRLHVTTPAGVGFATGLSPDGRDAQTYGGTLSDLPITPYSAFGRLRQHTVSLDGGARSVAVAIAGAELAIGDEALVRWVARKAAIVAAYYGHFPVARALVIVLVTEGNRFDFGKTLGNGGASILLPMGEHTTSGMLASDWVLVHEMMHVGFPSLGRQHSWLEEGMATYVEPVARARAGDLATHELWRGLIEGLPKGLPQPGDQGLEQTHTWGRTYWGGALFWLLADVAIREQTHNRRTLDDALRGMVAAGGTVAERWDVARVIAVGDAATGTAVLADLYGKMANDPFVVDLSALWKRLGVRIASGRVIFEDAPLSYVRGAIAAR